MGTAFRAWAVDAGAHLSPTMQILLLSMLNVLAMLSNMKPEGLPTTVGSLRDMRWGEGARRGYGHAPQAGGQGGGGA